MKFIHTSDLHLGVRPDAGPEYTKRRPEEIWETFKSILDRCEDEQIDLLHKELQYYKEAQADRLIDQAMKEVIQVRNGLLKTLRSEGWKSMDEEMLRQVIVYLEEDITDLLERQTIDPFESLPGEPFDPSKHRAAEVVPTEDEALDHRIQTSKSPGYRKNDRILVHEAVTVCRLHTEKK